MSPGGPERRRHRHTVLIARPLDPLEGCHRRRLTIRSSLPGGRHSGQSLVSAEWDTQVRELLLEMCGAVGTERRSVGRRRFNVSKDVNPSVSNRAARCTSLDTSL